MIDFTVETPYTLARTTKELEKLYGKRLSIPTVWRWCVKGVKGVQLEHSRMGRTIFTSAEALNRFSERVAEAAINAPTPAPTPTITIRRRSPAQKQRDVAAARERLAKAGIHTGSA